MADNKRRPTLATSASPVDHPERLSREGTALVVRVARSEVARLRDTARRADSLAGVLAEWALLDVDMFGFAALANRIYVDVTRTLVELEAVS